LCGVWLTAWTSRADVGQRARRWGLFLIPEETEPPPELVMATAAERIEAAR
jgi:membrane glycosyltransferase